MKHKAIALLAISALLLSACNTGTAENTSDDISYEVTAISGSSADQEETSAESISPEEQTETLTERETIIKGFEEDYIPETEPQAEISEGQAFRTIECPENNYVLYAGDDIIVFYDMSNYNYEESTGYVTLNFTDPESRPLGSVKLPEGFYSTESYKGTDGVLFYLSDSHYDEETQQIESVTVKINEDLSMEVMDDPDTPDYVFEAGGHKFANRGIDLYCMDGEPEMIIPGYAKEGDEFGFYTRSIAYKFPIDNDRFVYSKSGYESIPGFGVYDFSAGKASDVPDSSDHVPFGVKDNKIYSVRTEWDGFGAELFVTDADTLETEPFADLSQWLDGLTSVFFFMPESGEYIIAITDSYETGIKAYRISIDSGKITDEYDFPEGYYFYTNYGFTKNGELMIDYKDGLILFKF